MSRTLQFRDCSLGSVSCAALVIASLGLLTMIVNLSHLITEFNEYMVVIGAVVPPLLLSVGLIGGSYWLWESDIDSRHHSVIVGWMGGTILAMSVVGTSNLIFEVAHGTGSPDFLFIAVNWITIGGFTGFLIGIYDARHRMEREALREQRQALATREQELERENDRLDRFAGILSHDLRNPLNVAEGRLEILQDDHESEHLDAVQAALNRIETLVDDALTMARNGRTIDNEERQPVNLASRAEKCWDLVETADADLEIEGNGILEAEPGRVSAIFENLYRNAIEHGGEDVTVSVGRVENNGGFYIEDDGRGIPEEADDVFEPGYSSNHDGTGLGLSIVQETAEAHGWDVDLADGFDGGARFEITNVDMEAPDER
jgi:signal transduction histidine kinase